MRTTNDEAFTLGIFAGLLLALLGLTWAADEDGSGIGRGAGVLFVVAGCALVWRFWTMLRTHTASSAEARDPEPSLSGSHLATTRDLHTGIIDDRLWRARMWTLSLLIRLHK